MKKTISSSATFFEKFIFSSVWIIFSLFFLSSMLIYDFNKDSIFFIVALVIGTIAVYWFCIRLKKVSISDKYLYISNYFKEIAVERSDIENIRKGYLFNFVTITIFFKKPTTFGSSIVFISKVNFHFFSPDPVWSELYKNVKTKPQLPDFVTKTQLRR